MKNQSISTGSSTAKPPLDLSSYNSWDSLAALLKVKSKTLRFFAHAPDRGTHYRTFEVPKRSGGTRTISAPKKALSELQSRIASILESSWTPAASAYGFVKLRDIAKGATRHVKKRAVLNIDLKDFFQTIHFGRVKGRLQRYPFKLSDRQATIFASICTYEARLPQGAPSSPALSNFVCERLDRELLAYARQHKAVYTRYADDITLSWNQPKSDIAFVDWEPTSKTVSAKPSQALRGIIETNGFTINDAKTALRLPFNRQEVTGLVVNEELNVRRHYLRRIRAIINDVEKNGWYAAAQNNLQKRPFRRPPKDPVEAFKRRVAGMLNFVRFVKSPGDPVYIRYANKLRVHLPEFRKEDQLIKAENGHCDVFICHASEDKKSVVRPLKQALDAAKIPAWVDENRIKWGSSLIDSIQDALKRSKLVVVVLSTNSINKAWPLLELKSALTMELAKTQVRVLPLLVGTDTEIKGILSEMPLLNDKKYEKWAHGPVAVVESLKHVLHDVPASVVESLTPTVSTDDELISAKNTAPTNALPSNGAASKKLAPKKLASASKKPAPKKPAPKKPAPKKPAPKKPAPKKPAPKKPAPKKK